jgi:hypothetical protein
MKTFVLGREKRFLMMRCNLGQEWGEMMSWRKVIRPYGEINNVLHKIIAFVLNRS